jgi:hypothetical protein
MAETKKSHMTDVAKVEIRWLGPARDNRKVLWEQYFRPPLAGFWWYDALDRCGIDDLIDLLLTSKALW